jgi:hypothetical protein
VGAKLTGCIDTDNREIATEGQAIVPQATLFPSQIMYPKNATASDRGPGTRQTWLKEPDVLFFRRECQIERDWHHAPSPRPRPIGATSLPSSSNENSMAPSLSSVTTSAGRGPPSKHVLRVFHGNVVRSSPAKHEVAAKLRLLLPYPTRFHAKALLGVLPQKCLGIAWLEAHCPKAFLVNHLCHPQNLKNSSRGAVPKSQTPFVSNMFSVSPLSC